MARPDAGAEAFPNLGVKDAGKRREYIARMRTIVGHNTLFWSLAFLFIPLHSFRLFREV